MNLAGEPRDILLIDGAVGQTGQAPVPAGIGERLRRRDVLVRVALMAGAAQCALTSTLRHVERLLGQFDRLVEDIAVSLTYLNRYLA